MCNLMILGYSTPYFGQVSNFMIILYITKIEKLAEKSVFTLKYIEGVVPVTSTPIPRHVSFFNSVCVAWIRIIRLCPTMDTSL
jgi:hypothetical protein